MTGPWTCPTDEQWNRYLLDPEVSEHEELARHVERCQFCRIRVAELANDLDELAAAWRASAQPGTIFFMPIGGTLNQDAAATVLAAEGDEQVPLAESATLASPGQEMFLRVVRNQHTREVWLYVITDDPARSKSVIVKPFGRNEEYVTDLEGRINLGRADWPAPESLTALVYLPHATFLLGPLADTTEPGESVVLTSPGGDRIQVEFFGIGRNRRLEIHLLKTSELYQEAPLRIGVRQAGGLGVLQVRPVVSEEVSFEHIETEGALEIYLYQ